MGTNILRCSVNLILITLVNLSTSELSLLALEYSIFNMNHWGMYFWPELFGPLEKSMGDIMKNVSEVMDIISNRYV